MERKAKLIKKDNVAPEHLTPPRRSRKSRATPPSPARTALEYTTEWLKRRREESGSARETFASLFANSDPQSA